MKLKEELTIADFKEMSLLEEQFYDPSHITPYEEAFDWYEKYPYSNKVMENNGQIIGFVDMFLIHDEIFQLLKLGKFNDKELTAHDIVDIDHISEGTFSMFLCCVVIHQDFRKTDVLRHLLNAHIEFYKTIQEKGIRIDFIITDNVTERGENFSKRMGFHKVIETEFQSVVYMEKYQDFIENLKLL